MTIDQSIHHLHYSCISFKTLTLERTIEENFHKCIPSSKMRFPMIRPVRNLPLVFSKISFRCKIAPACEIHIVNALSCLDVPPFTTTGFPPMDKKTTSTSNFVEMCVEILNNALYNRDEFVIYPSNIMQPKQPVLVFYLFFLKYQHHTIQD